jgi:hypothetical protein
LGIENSILDVLRKSGKVNLQNEHERRKGEDNKIIEVKQNRRGEKVETATM